MGDSQAEIGRHVRIYLGVFAALAGFTVLTVLVSRVHFPGAWNILVALMIAAVKASLVAAVFMHLKWERSVSIWWALAFCVMFFLVLMLLPVLADLDFPPQTHMSTWG